MRGGCSQARADGSIVNCVAPHPTEPILAVSGIDSNVKLFAPGDVREPKLAKEGVRRRAAADSENGGESSGAEGGAEGASAEGSMPFASPERRSLRRRLMRSPRASGECSNEEASERLGAAERLREEGNAKFKDGVRRDAPLAGLWRADARCLVCRR